MAQTPTRLFSLLVRLRRSHGIIIRALAAGVSAIVVFVIVWKSVLAREIAGLFWRDDFVTGLHRLRWYLHHGWPRILIRSTPDFDPTTRMHRDAVLHLDRFLTGRNDTTGRLAQLAVLARRIQDHTDSTEQAKLMDRYTAVADVLTDQIAPPDLTAKPNKGEDFSLTEATAALKSLDRHLTLPWFIISGTFLGTVREGGFLSHDYDIDIGIHAADFDPDRLMADVHGAPDLVLVTDSPAGELTPREGGGWDMHNWPALFTVMHKSGLLIDVFVHHTIAGDCWHGSAKHRWSNSPFELAPYMLAGVRVLGPADANRYLTENYGNWRVPVTTFNCSTGTPNVRFHRNLSAIAAFLRAAVQGPGTASAAVAVLVLQQEGYLDTARTRFTLPWREAV